MEKRRKHIIGLLIGLLLLAGLTAGLKSCDTTVALPCYDENVTEKYGSPAASVDRLINSISKPITLDSAAAVENARKAYNELSDNDKAKVTALDKLVEYENTLKELNAQIKEGTAAWVKRMLDELDPNNTSFADLAKVRLAYEALNATEKAKFDLAALEKAELSLPNIGEYLNHLLGSINLPVSAEHNGLLSRIRTLFNGLSDAEKASFNLSKLEEYENSINNLGIDPDYVADLISGISLPITLDSEKDIENALDAYDVLSEEEKAKVTNYSSLLDYVTQLNELKSAADGSSDGVPDTGVE